MENIIVELNGKKYLSVELFTTTSNEKKITAKCTKYDAIYQGIKEIHRGGLWTNSYVVIKVLVPEENVIAFNND